MESPKLYSPVSVQSSPLNLSKGNLTGTPRQVRDLSADLYNLVQEWISIIESGSRCVKKIMDIKSNGFAGSIIYPDGLQTACDALIDEYNRLKDVVFRMNSVYNKFQGLKKLEELKGLSQVIFLTWKIENYVKLSKELKESYDKELEVKLYVVQNIGHVEHDKDLLQFYTLWSFQSYINPIFNFKIEAVLKETGYR